MAQKDVKSRIASVKNIQKITRAMEMVAAARLRRAEQRIEALRPYAAAIRRMTRQAAEAAENIPNVPLLAEPEVRTASACCSWRATAAWRARSTRRSCALASRAGASTSRGPSGRLLRLGAPRRVVADVPRQASRSATYTGYTDRPSYANAREIAADLMAAYVDGEVDRVEIFYNRYSSALTRRSRARLCSRCSGARSSRRSEDGDEDDERGPRRAGAPRAQVEYEPDPAVILRAARARLRRDLDLPRAARIHRVGARRPHDRHAQRLGQRRRLIKDLTLQMNRARQAEITQEIMEVVAGAESLV